MSFRQQDLIPDALVAFPKLTPDRMPYTLEINGNRAGEAIKALNRRFKLQLGRDDRTGKVYIKGKVKYQSLSKQQQRLYDIVESPGKTVKLTANDKIEATSRAGVTDLVVGGFYDGVIKNDTIVDGKKVVSYTGFQIVNIVQAQALERIGIQSAGTTVFHEIDESFTAMEMVHSIPGLHADSVYFRAHPVAIKRDPLYKADQGKFYKENGKRRHIWFNTDPQAPVDSTGHGWEVLQ